MYVGGGHTDIIKPSCGHVYKQRVFCSVRPNRILFCWPHFSFQETFPQIIAHTDTGSKAGGATIQLHSARAKTEFLLYPLTLA